MTRRRVHQVLLVFVAMLVASGAWGWWYLTDGRFPLAGDTHHDFGTVPIPGVTASFDHTFTLRNRTGGTIEIETIRPGCGCTKATPSTNTLAPDETVDIDVTLSLSKAGRKRVNIVLMIAGHRPQSLWVQALGRKETVLGTAVEHLALAPGAPQTLLVTAAVQSSDDVPPAPLIAAPDGVAATFMDWTAMTKRDPSTRRAAHWRGRLSVELVGRSLPEGAQLELALGEAKLAIELSMRVGRPGAAENPPAPAPGDR